MFMIFDKLCIAGTKKLIEIKNCIKVSMDNV